MKSLTDHLASAVEAETSVLQFTVPDPMEKQERLTELHHDNVVKRTAAISKARSNLRKTVEALDAEIARLEKEKEQAVERAGKLIESEDRIIAASRAFIAAMEGITE